MTREFDPVLVEVINNELSAVTEEMAVVIWRSGQSAQLKSGDFATAVCDMHGRIVGQGFAAPFQLAVLEEMVRHVVAHYGDDFAPGDVIITNDPFTGMGHMPDFGVVVPVFHEGRRAAFCIAYSHHADVGGRFPGSFSSEGTSSYEEGLLIPIVKFVEAGRPNKALQRVIRANVRVPDEWDDDMQAKIAGCSKGAEQIGLLLQRHGWESYAAANEHAIEHAERSMRAAIAAVPDGRYEASYTLAEPATTIEIKAVMEIAGDQMTVDFTGSSPQVGVALNSPLTMTKAGVYGALKCILGAELPTNGGFFRPVRIVAPLGSVLNPEFPAAVAGRAPVFFRVFDVIYRALAEALPGRVPVTGEGGDALHLSGHRQDGSEYSFLDLYFGGWGGRPSGDGIDGVAPVFMGSYGSVSIELLEAENPVIFDGFGFVPDSEGAGQHRGSLAIYRQWRFLGPAHAMVRTGRLEPAAGLLGGRPGTPSRSALLRDGKETPLPLRTHHHVDVRPGDAIYHSTAGAGGYGDPRTRDPQLVARDVRAGIVSTAAAAERYGVAVGAQGEVDDARTAVLRGRA